MAGYFLAISSVGFKIFMKKTLLISLVMIAMIVSLAGCSSNSGKTPTLQTGQQGMMGTPPEDGGTPPEGGMAPQGEGAGTTRSGAAKNSSK